FKIEDFIFLRILGCGTFGKVYLCRTKLSCAIRYFAIKVMRKYDIITMRQVDHVDSEQKIMRQISNKHIVRLFSTFEHNTRLFLVMEYVPGGELYYYLRRRGRFTVSEAQFYSAEILLALKELHSNKIVYRDLKPENILLDKEGHVKLTDFGFSKTLNTTAFTQCGTPEYLAPEIILGNPYDKTVDFWALGIIIYEMIVGCPPFFDQEHHIMYEKIINDDVKYPYMEKKAKNLISRLLVKDPRFRIGFTKIEELFEHEFFIGFWSKLISGRVQPPIKPFIRFDGDSNCFPYYEEEPEKTEN
ncbi:Protein kinase domain, partial [Trinorchestia longiramus]